MKPSLVLHELIKSLTEEEKAVFLQTSSLQQGEKNYMKLFSYLDSQETYNEEKTKTHFKSETFAKHLASEKNQLFHHILKSLRLQRILSKTAANVYDKIKDVQLLYSKGLYKLADREAATQKEYIINQELYFSLLSLISTELKFVLSSNLPEDKINEKLERLLKEKEVCLNEIETIIKYQKLLGEIDYYFNQNILVHDNSKKPILESFLSHPYIIDTSKATSNRAMLVATFCRLICFRIIAENDKLGIEIYKAVELFKNFPYLKTEFPKLYINLYGFLARYLAINANLGEAKLAIDHIRSIRDEWSFRSTDIQNTIFTRLSIFDLIFYNYSAQFDTALVLADEVEEKLESKEKKYPGHELTTINFLMFVANFAKENYNKSLKYINEIVNSDFEDSRQDLFRYAKLCNLILHYELNNSEYLIYSYKSTLRFFKSIDFPFDYELAFLKHFKNIAIAKKRPDSKKHYFIEFKNTLTTIFEDPSQMIASEYFDLLAWVDSKINDTSYAEEVKKQRDA